MTQGRHEDVARTRQIEAAKVTPTTQPQRPICDSTGKFLLAWKRKNLINPDIILRLSDMQVMQVMEEFALAAPGSPTEAPELYDAGIAGTEIVPPPIAYLCPHLCGCLWRDNHDGTMSLFGPNSKSCVKCEVLPLSALMPLLAAPGSTRGPTDLEREVKELRAWKESAMVQLGKSERLMEVLPTPDYWGWDVYDGAVDYIKKLKAKSGGDEVEGGATPQPTHCPLCGSSRRQTLRPNGGCLPDSHDPWHDGAAPLMEQSTERYKPVLSLTNKEQSPPLSQDEARGIVRGLDDIANGRVRPLKEIEEELQHKGGDAQ